MYEISESPHRKRCRERLHRELGRFVAANELLLLAVRVDSGGTLLGLARWCLEKPLSLFQLSWMCRRIGETWIKAGHPDEPAFTQFAKRIIEEGRDVKRARAEFIGLRRMKRADKKLDTSEMDRLS